MNLELTKQQLNYLITTIEQSLIEDPSINNKHFMNMLHNLYSKLIVLTKETE